MVTFHIIDENGHGLFHCTSFLVIGIVYFTKGKKYPIMIIDNYEFKLDGKTDNKTYWRCTKRHTKCKARLHTSGKTIRTVDNVHNHPPSFKGEPSSLIAQKVHDLSPHLKHISMYY